MTTRPLVALGRSPEPAGPPDASGKALELYRRGPGRPAERQMPTVPTQGPVGHLELDAMPPRPTGRQLVQHLLHLSRSGHHTPVPVQPMAQGIGLTLAAERLQTGDAGWTGKDHGY